MDFNKKIAVVTGGTTGIGESVCKKLKDKGALVYNLDIAESNSEGMNFIKCDVGNLKEQQEAIQYILQKEGKIDFLFANAGIHLFANIEDTSYDDFEKIISTNIKGVYYSVKEIIPIMKNQNYGNIVLMGSDQSLIGKGSSSVYGMTKGAIGQLTKSTAIDYAQFNIRVNCICPGTIETPLLDKAVQVFKKNSGLSENEIIQSLKEAQPIQRIAKPSEIANVVCFLLSDESSFMTGSLVSADGGYTCQ